jgi:hypothetical protein
MEYNLPLTFHQIIINYIVGYMFVIELGLLLVVCLSTDSPNK